MEEETFRRLQEKVESLDKELQAKTQWLYNEILRLEDLVNDKR